MDATRFDTISKLFADRLTRRATVAGAASLAAGLGMTAIAQEGTPEVATPAMDPTNPHPSADGATAHSEFLFVQPFEGGTWAPKDDENGVFTLTLTGAAAQTVYFSNRPERIVGLSPMRAFLDGLGFSPANPPNAALVAHTDEGAQEILVIELLNPVWDGNSTLTYDAKILADYGEYGLAHLARQQTDVLAPQTFGTGGLFIDGCPCWAVYCRNSITGATTTPRCTAVCYSESTDSCTWCDDPAAYCIQHHPEECTSSQPQDVNAVAPAPVCMPYRDPDAICLQC